MIEQRAETMLRPADDRQHAVSIDVTGFTPVTGTPARVTSANLVNFRGVK